MSTSGKPDFSYTLSEDYGRVGKHQHQVMYCTCAARDEEVLEYVYSTSDVLLLAL